MKKSKSDLPSKLIVILMIISHWLFFIFAIVLFLKVTITEAKANSVATIVVPDIPASVHTQCDAEKNFTFHIIKLRESGQSLKEVNGNIVAKMIAMGLPIEAIAETQKTIASLWAMEGNSESISNQMYQLCIDAYREEKK